MSSESKVVVHIEDEPDMIRLARLVLRKKGLNLIGAKDGREGLTAFLEKREPAFNR